MGEGDQNPGRQGGHASKSITGILERQQTIIKALADAQIRLSTARNGEHFYIEVQPESMERFALWEAVQQKVKAGDLVRIPTYKGAALGFTGDANALRALAEQFKAQNIDTRFHTTKDGPLLRVRSESVEDALALLPREVNTDQLPIKLLPSPNKSHRPGAHGVDGGLHDPKRGGAQILDGGDVLGELRWQQRQQAAQQSKTPPSDRLSGQGADVIGRAQELREKPTAELAKGKVVILVDDSPLDTILNKTLLTKMGVEVITVSDVTEVADAAKQIPPDRKLAGIITDNTMPSDADAGLKLQAAVKRGTVPSVSERTPVAVRSAGMTEDRSGLVLPKSSVAELELTARTLLIQSQLESEGLDVGQATKDMGKGKSLMDVVEAGMSPEALRQYKLNRLDSLEKQVEFARQFASDPTDYRSGVTAYTESDAACAVGTAGCRIEKRGRAGCGAADG